MTKVITTVGTSLFENYIEKNPKQIDDKYPELINKEFSEWDNYKTYIKSIKEKISLLNYSDPNISAEVKSILKIKGSVNDDIKIYFICSDSILTKLAADCISAELKVNGISFEESRIVDNLNTKEHLEFELKGLTNLIDKIEGICNGYFGDVILNVTGGYKGTVPYLTIWAQLNSVPIKYIFENSESLITIPNAPIDINLGMFEKYSNVFIKLDNTVKQSKTEFIRENNLYGDFPKEFIQEISEDENYLLGLDPIGKIFWDRYNNFDVVEIPMGSKFFNEEANKKSGVTSAIKELIKRLKLIDNFETIVNQDLKHAALNENTWIYKHSNPQVRLHYKYQSKKLIIYNYYFKPQNENYSTSFAKEFEGLKNSEKTIITFYKENN